MSRLSDLNGMHTMMIVKNAATEDCQSFQQLLRCQRSGSKTSATYATLELDFSCHLSIHGPAIAFLRDTFRSKTRSDWERWFEGRDICWSPVVSLWEAWQSDHVRERGMRFQDSDGNDHIGSPIKFSSEAPEIASWLPAVGEHTAAIIDELDLTDSDRQSILQSS